MNAEEFRKYGKEMVDFVADFWENIRERTPLPDVKPGYISAVVPKNPPAHPEDWRTIFGDLEDVVMKGNTYWHHPHFFAYYPTACSYPAIMGDILSGGIAGVGFTWKAGPAMTELEMATLDWLVDVLGLPEHFKALKNGSDTFSWMGSTELEKTVKGILAKVRQNTIEEEDSGIICPHYHDPAVFEKFIAYCSDQAHSSVEKGAMLCAVKLRKLKTTLDPELKSYTVTKEVLEESIKEDRARGLIPFILIATMGTTPSCGVDRLDSLGPICAREHIWLHVDGAYGGSFLACPEFRYMSRGMEFVDSFNFNAHKALFVNEDCSPMWLKDGKTAAKYFNVDPVYLKHEHQALVSDYRQNQQAALFAKLIDEDKIFELFVPQHLGLVCFRIKNSTNEENEALYKAINKDRRIHLVPSKVQDIFFLRLAICSQLTTDEDVRFAYDVCKQVLTHLKTTSCTTDDRDLRISKENEVITKETNQLIE
ncbi:hypothetical protein ANCCAN_08689 [Ancylostoma caninum]|uniref:Aromatic-L-amino-acid decarboxylase n=1 Tax=Ancylostoma caninum TaxID=29170 RepID=A0A368GLN6_ANCCA|nr:hypothetical protein ANCCAN_08689 [Ancylostoma caninum]